MRIPAVLRSRRTIVATAVAVGVLSAGTAHGGDSASGGVPEPTTTTKPVSSTVTTSPLPTTVGPADVVAIETTKSPADHSLGSGDDEVRSATTVSAPETTATTKSAPQSDAGLPDDDRQAPLAEAPDGPGLPAGAGLGEPAPSRVHLRGQLLRSRPGDKRLRHGQVVEHERQLQPWQAPERRRTAATASRTY